MLVLPEGAWSKKASLAEIEALTVTEADSALEWATGIAITIASGATWDVQLEGWRVLPKFVVRRRARVALAQLGAGAR
jgi:hypothetical protein